eukprot:CAMPEP_0119319650 /NCGR_PEP_ID=MMETSP1333-20130426/49981_1 /TAXON_ID=418940 /ORGANISM="Scyphosphaera apsteinii, Strain RCC1455" /LENGTH=396 /DNA_ID=CAMNT_0007326117 /DNA_START=101 /DNA_END=1291 /DNA_ORIENTATION=-
MPQPPRLPPSFSVTLSQTYSAPSFQLGQFSAAWPNQTSTFFFENTTDGTLRQRVNRSAGFASTAWTLYTPANDSLRVYAQFANDCRPLPLNFTFNQGLDLSWLPWSTFAGEIWVGLFKKANKFEYSDHRAPFNYSVIVSQDKNELLFVDTIWTGSLPGTGNTTQSIRYKFENLMERLLPPTLFTIPIEGCFEKVPTCQDGKVTGMDVYLAHPHQYRYLDDEDTGDARGDVVFLCPDLLNPGSSAFNLYDAVSQWRVEVDSHWGQYQQCNGYPGLCFGLEDFAVGRQVPYGSITVPRSGQCTPNSESGSWLSHTAGGKCAQGNRPAPGVCSWRPIERVKTISLACLASKMTGACRSDIMAAGGVPFPLTHWIFNTSLPVFLKAFASEKVALGGCPAI